ncbi:hypothetical protein HFO58_31950 [Rhizobium leguminosarum]|uniref:hypothetical protein n=1 Tax=Rhizobium leguminosarum TaxID=384 RepID=UPI001C939559|nr:hypothetical protein [Rhizobium leguminosarum]MBY5537707.1 hypothetical protein [Rhizobium leguminosarum]
MIDLVYDAADEEIHQALERATAEHPDRSISSWSLRVSAQGLQIEPMPIDDWVQEQDLNLPCYLHSFQKGDTFRWLHGVINDHRDALKRLLVNFVVRRVGYEQTTSLNTFVDALERRLPERKRLVPVLDDSIVW